MDPHELWLRLLKEGVPQEKAAQLFEEKLGGWDRLTRPREQVEAEAAFWDAPPDGPDTGDSPSPWSDRA